jgi:metal-dependent amidase/aminoacylase/carboxypeptidase family protein
MYSFYSYSNLNTNRATITYKGRASHAAVFPWEGVNALDAAVNAYQSVSNLRQQMKPTWRVHGIIFNPTAISKTWLCNYELMNIPYSIDLSIFLYFLN